MTKRKPDWECTWWFEGDWTDCCIAHDYDCQVARNKQERFEADVNLMMCVHEKGNWYHPIIAWIMFIGVRLYSIFRVKYK